MTFSYILVVDVGSRTKRGGGTVRRGFCQSKKLRGDMSIMVDTDTVPFSVELAESAFIPYRPDADVEVRGSLARGGWSKDGGILSTPIACVASCATSKLA